MNYIHDCEHCKFLSEFKDAPKDGGIINDLYFCNKGPTVIARFGNDPIQYTSGLDSRWPALVYAKHLAEKNGFFDPSKVLRRCTLEEVPNNYWFEHEENCYMKVMKIPSTSMIVVLRQGECFGFGPAEILFANTSVTLVPEDKISVDIRIAK